MDESTAIDPEMLVQAAREIWPELPDNVWIVPVSSQVVDVASNKQRMSRPCELTERATVAGQTITMGVAKYDETHSILLVNLGEGGADG